MFHQANGFMLDRLRRKIGIPAEKFVLAMEDVGNTVSSSIPIALQCAERRGQLKPGALVMLSRIRRWLFLGRELIRWAATDLS